jgi:hypothetical protein
MCYSNGQLTVSTLKADPQRIKDMYNHKFSKNDL